MKIQSSKRVRNKKPLIITLIVIAIVAIAAGAFFFYYTSTQENRKLTEEVDRTSAVQQEQVETTADTPVTCTELPSKTGSTEGTCDTSNVETPSTPPEKPTIERAGGNPTVKVVATFQQASNGYCELQLMSSSAQIKTYKSDIVVGTSYYSCNFSVARSDLGSADSWTAVVIHRVGDAQTKSDSAEVN
jgi:type II secretory pathway pseudopilin PulG